MSVGFILVRTIFIAGTNYIVPASFMIILNYFHA